MSNIFEVTEIVAATGGEPRMSVALLAERLGMPAKRTRMDLIDRNMDSLLQCGGFLSTVSENPSAKGGQPTKDYLLNEGQAIFIAAKSETPAANSVLLGLVHVFMAYRHGPATPAAVNREERADMQMKRLYADSLPDAHKAKAAKTADAVRQVNKLIDEGYKISAAVKEVAAATGIGVRTLWQARKESWMVAPSDYEVTFAPRWKWNGPKGMQAACHPEALRLFVNLCLSGAGIADCYCRMIGEAKVRGWAPIPHERTLRRAVERLRPQRGVAGSPAKASDRGGQSHVQPVFQHRSA